jgi:uncharacterized protein
MQYRKFGKSGWEILALGLGMGRLPMQSGNPPEIDQAETEKIVRYVIENGVNYLDLGCNLDPAQHERILKLVGKILKNGYREKVRLALRMSPLPVNNTGDFDRCLDSSLELLATDRIDFFVLGWLDRETWPKLQRLEVLEWAGRAVASGKIAALGFAFHDQFQFLKDIMSSFSGWTLAQFQYSFMDVDHHPGVSGINYAAENGLGVVAAEPLRGGRLTRQAPDKVAAIWAGAQPQRPLYQWGLDWVWNHPAVSTAVVDISSLKQAQEDVALAESSRADSLTVPEEVLISYARDAYRKLKAFPCTACRSCMPCPQGIDAPRIFELYNDAIMFGDTEIPRSLYRFEGHSVDACNECGSCVRLCGRRIDIPLQLKAADRMLRL